jgi:predicted RNase H-like nuclease (RuvC/YqgF family)
VSDLQQAIGAYRSITATNEFKELERLRSRARHNEASALENARREEREKVNSEWQSKVAEKDARIAELEAELAKYRNQKNKKSACAAIIMSAVLIIGAVCAACALGVGSGTGSNASETAQRQITSNDIILLSERGMDLTIDDFKDYGEAG